MALPPQFDEPALRALNRLDDAVDRGQARLFRVLWFRIPPGSVAWNLQFQALMASRFLTDMAMQALLYGALIATARADGTAFDAGLLGTAYLLPGVLLGLYGGVVADAVPKRVALVTTYLLMGVLCFLIPGFFGTDFRSLLLILFAIRVLHQVSQPSEASAVPLVASSDELASATSFIQLASSGGDLVGKALMAPLLVRLFGVDPVVVIAGVLFLLSATRVFGLKPGWGAGAPARTAGAPVRVSVWAVARWLLAERAVLWMLLLASIASTIGVVLGMLVPQYTGEVLGVDPANALYVFAPVPIGLLAALALAPLSIRLLGERMVAAIGFLMVAATMPALGQVAPLTDRFGDLLPFGIPGVGQRVEMAATLSIFLGFGITYAGAATQTYVGRYVPLGIQGRTFAILGTLKDGLSIAPLLVLGSVAGLVGVDTVITIAPLVLIVLALGIDRFVGRYRPPRPESA